MAGGQASTNSATSVSGRAAKPPKPGNNAGLRHKRNIHSLCTLTATKQPSVESKWFNGAHTQAFICVDYKCCAFFQSPSILRVFLFASFAKALPHIIVTPSWLHIIMPTSLLLLLATLSDIAH